MLPLPFVDVTARIVFYSMFVVFLLVEWRATRHSRGPASTGTDRHTRAFVLACIGVGFAVGFGLAATVTSAAIAVARWPVFVVGVVTMAVGVAIRWWAVAVLGRYFTTDVRVAADQTVIDTGPYRWVRHPSYSGSLLTLVGIGLALGNALSLAVLVLLPLIGYVVRIRVEESALATELGESYTRYAASCSRLLPGLW